MFIRFEKPAENSPTELNDSATVDYIILPIDEKQKCYVSPNSERYYSSSFDSLNQSKLFKFYSETNKRYRISVSHPRYTEIALLNSNFDTISFLDFDYYKNGLHYLANKNTELYISIKVESLRNENLDFELHLEYVDYKDFVIQNTAWKSYGPWVWNSEIAQITVSNNNAHRWIAPQIRSDEFSYLSFTFKRLDSLNTFPDIGIFFNGSDEFSQLGFHKNTLPATGIYAHLTDTNLLQMEDQDELGASFDYHTIDSLDFFNGVKFELINDNNSMQLKIDNQIVITRNEVPQSKTLIVIEEKGYASCTIEDIIIN